MPKFKPTKKLVCFDKYKCKNCGIEKDINSTNFERRNKLNGRFSLQCKFCLQAKATQRDKTLEGKKRNKLKRERLSEYHKAYHKLDKTKKKAQDYRKSYHGRGIRKALDAKRRSAKLNRTPVWADLKAIEQFYKDCPKNMQVDHIIPLQGTSVSGFHILENLQYLSASENGKKRNKF